MIGEDYKTSTAYTFRAPLRDGSGALQTGKSPTVVIYQPDGSLEASPPSPAELGASGVYAFSYALPAAQGAYTFVLAASGCLPVVWTIQARALGRADIAGDVWDHDLADKEATAKSATAAGAMLAGARAGAVGRLAISGTTLTLYEADGTTVLATFTLAGDYSARSAPA